jgi:uncharacterized FlgJ-related protein
MSIELPDLTIKPEEASEFYRLLGRALWAIGHFEYRLVHIIVVVFKSPYSSRKAVDDALEKEFDKTLGELLKEFRRFCDIAPDVDERLDKFKSERNWLCHRIYQQNHTNLFNHVKLESLFLRLEVFKRESTELNDIFDQIFNQWRMKKKISDEEMESRIKSTLNEWKNL